MGNGVQCFSAIYHQRRARSSCPRYKAPTNETQWMHVCQRQGLEGQWDALSYHWKLIDCHRHRSPVIQTPSHDAFEVSEARATQRPSSRNKKRERWNDHESRYRSWSAGQNNGLSICWWYVHQLQYWISLSDTLMLFFIDYFSPTSS